MFALNSITLIFNGLTLALALSFLIILLWYDAQKRVIQFFAIFLFLVILWNAGSLLVQAMILIGLDVNFAIGLMEVGFSGSSVALYVLVTILVGAHTRFFRVVAFASLILVVFYRIFLIVINNTTITAATIDSYRFQNLPVLFYFLFDTAALYISWQYRRKVRSNLIITGTTIFIVGQGIAFLNPEIPIVAISTNVSGFGALLLSLGIIRQEIILPLSERANEVEAIHHVSLAITSQLALETVLNEVVTQAAEWLQADGVGIFLRDENEDELELVNIYNLPPQLLHYRLKVGEGLAGTVASTQKSLYLENYSRDWKAGADLPYARETFGSVICVPLVYANQVPGALMVIAGKQGRLFNQNDMEQLERLGAQAAVAIAHSRLFGEVENARNQLETLLTSTENPVVAVSRNFRLMFINPAARKVFKIDDRQLHERVDRILPYNAFPQPPMLALHSIKKQGAYIYEVSLDDKVYMCHLAATGHQQIDGWVAVMNDITQLKELDRLKSEMVRMVSHDLKNPLMGAMLYLDLARDAANPAVMEPLGVIERQLERMNRIIRGVLDLEQIRSGLKTHETCDAGQLVEIATNELKRSAADKQISLKKRVETPGLMFAGDADQMERALINLIENAIKFTPEGGEIIVALRQDKKQIIFEVADTGVGIPPEMHQQVFERFFRGQQKGVEHVSGSGLGLSIVKTIVENHHGKIWLESEAGKGTRFFIALASVSTLPE